MQSIEPNDLVGSYRDFLDALPIVAYLARPDGSIAYVSRGWNDLIGTDIAEMLGDKYPSVIHPDQREQAVANYQAALRSGSDYRDEMMLRLRDNTYRWFVSRARPFRDPQTNAIVGWFGTVGDIAERKRSEERLRAQAAFNERLIESTDDCIKILDLDGGLVSMSVNGQKTLQIANIDELIGRSWFDFWTGEDKGAAQAAVAAARRGESGRFTGYFPVAGEARWFDVMVTPIVDAFGRPERLLGVSRDVTSRFRAARANAFLSEASRLLAESLDLETTLQSIAHLTIPRFADACQIDVRMPDGLIRTSAVAHRDANDNAHAQRLIGRVTADVGAHPGNAAVIRSGRPTLLEANAAACIPLVAQGQTLGAIALMYGESSRRYDDDDVPMFEELGRRAGSAIQNASDFAREHRVAASFQNASLPLELPRAPQVTFDAEYRPGSTEATIGGDWYDAFVLDDGCIAITVGDVLGHGLAAAVTMTKLRQAMQAAAMIDPDPNLMLRVADRTLRLDGTNSYATAMGAIYDPATCLLTFASAGHPGPFVRHADGRIEDCTHSGPMLGLRSGAETELAGVQTGPGSVLVFFTDGLIEASHDVLLGEERLAAALGSPAVLNHPRPACAIVDHVLGPLLASDDIAVLVARF